MRQSLTEEVRRHIMAHRMRVTKVDVALSVVSGLIELGVAAWVIRRKFAR